MPELIPVDHDPFEMKAPSLVPVEHDPFAPPPEGLARAGADVKQLGIGAAGGLLETPDVMGQMIEKAPSIGGIPGSVLGLGVKAGQKLFNKAIGNEGEDQTYYGGVKHLLARRGLSPDQYPAQGLEQRLFRTTGEFLGSPLTYTGPGGIATKAAWAVPSAIGSELAGTAAQGTKYEGPARMIGAMAAPATLSAAHRLIAPRPINPANAAAAERLRAQGVETTAGEVTDAASLRNIEAEAGTPHQEFRANQQTALTNAALRPIAPTPDQLAGARARARTPEQRAAVDEWERASQSGDAHEAVRAARPMIGQEIEHAAHNLDVHSDAELMGTLTTIERRLMEREGFPVRQEGPNGTWVSDHPTVQRLQRMRDNILAAFDLQPGRPPRNPTSWTGNWGRASVFGPVGASATHESIVTLRPPVRVPGQPGSGMWDILVDGVHENAFGTRADAERYIGQYLNNMQPVPPPGRLVMNGRAFQNLIEHSSPLSRAARGTDADLAHYAGEMKSALMDAAERTGTRRNTVPGTGAQLDYERFATARRQWANLLALEHASSVGNAQTIGRGQLNPISIRRAATFRNTTDYARGRGDFNQLAKDANALIREPPNSGTPGRLRIGARAVGSALGTGLGAVLGAGAGPWGAAAGAGTLGSIGAVAAPIAQSRFVMNPTVQRYLRSGRWQPASRAARTARNIRAMGPAAAHNLANPYQP